MTETDLETELSDLELLVSLFDGTEDGRGAEPFDPEPVYFSRLLVSALRHDRDIWETPDGLSKGVSVARNYRRKVSYIFSRLDRKTALRA